MTASIQTLRDHGVIRLAIAGELDLGTADALHEAIAAALATRAGTVCVDLAAVTFCDSAGIAALVKGRHLADRQTGKYQVINARDKVRQVLELTGVLSYLAGDDVSPSTHGV